MCVWVQRGITLSVCVCFVPELERETQSVLCLWFCSGYICAFVNKSKTKGRREEEKHNPTFILWEEGNFGRLHPLARCARCWPDDQGETDKTARAEKHTPSPVTVCRE